MILAKQKYDEEFTRLRLNDLHKEVFGVKPSLTSLLAYFEYHRILNVVFNCGRDLSNHPRNPFNLSKP